MSESQCSYTHRHFIALYSFVCSPLKDSTTLIGKFFCFKILLLYFQFDDLFIVSPIKPVPNRCLSLEGSEMTLISTLTKVTFYTCSFTAELLQYTTVNAEFISMSLSALFYILE